jgi:hypothetical protein
MMRKEFESIQPPPAKAIPWPFLLKLVGSKKRVSEALVRVMGERVAISRGAPGCDVLMEMLSAAGEMLDAKELADNERAHLEVMLDVPSGNMVVKLTAVAIKLPSPKTGITSVEELEAFESAQVKL